MTHKYLAGIVFGLLFAVPTIIFAAEDSFRGPGDCATRDECKIYCDVDAHREECLNFAEQNGIMSKEEVEKAKKFIQQTGPGGCIGEECRTYCENPAHQEECVTFGLEHGFITKEDAERFKKFREIEEKGGGPGGCRGEECKTYCDDPAHEDECFEFAKKNGLIKPEDEKHYEAGRKIRQKIKTGEAPGSCSSEVECRNYCSDIGHVEECVKFGASQTGMSEAEVRLMLQEFKDRKRDARQFNDGQRQFSGPGGCSSEAECRAYCSQNPKECSKFSPPNGERESRPEGKNYDNNRQMEQDKYDGRQDFEFQGDFREQMKNMSPEDQERYEQYMKNPQGIQPQNMQFEENMKPGQYPQYEQNYQQNNQPPSDIMHILPPEGGYTPPSGSGAQVYQFSTLANILSAFLNFFGVR